MKILNSKQNLRIEKGIYSYLVKFYRTIDTICAEYTSDANLWRSKIWRLSLFHQPPPHPQ